MTDPVTRQQVLDACAEVMSPHAVEFWMRSTNRLLDHASPDELIERGEGERALALLAALAEGVIL